MSAAYLYDGIRTPFGRHGGALAGVRPDDLAAHVMRALLARSPSLDPALIGDVLFGAANGAGEDNRNVARMAVLLAGLPTSVPGATINRLCGSSLDAAMQASRAIESGDALPAVTVPSFANAGFSVASFSTDESGRIPSSRSSSTPGTGTTPSE